MRVTQEPDTSPRSSLQPSLGGLVPVSSSPSLSCLKSTLTHHQRKEEETGKIEDNETEERNGREISNRGGKAESDALLFGCPRFLVTRIRGYVCLHSPSFLW